MRSGIRFFTALTFLVAVLAVPALWTGNAAPIRSAAPEKPGIPVDVELVIAVDISYSMDPDEQALQREGYIKALTSREFLQALRQGINGKIAITYFEWAGYTERRVVVPWRVIEGPESADAFVGEIAAAPYRRAARTSISGAIEFGAGLFENSGYRGLRRVLDISGDGANNNGQLVTVSRDEALAKGITINGLPIMLKRGSYVNMDIDKLDVYYEDCVIGGPGAFVIAIEERDKFIEATRTKLVLEIAGRVPPARIIPVAADKPRVPCTIGERLWQERWGN
jgi:uncharacterized protein DUF1194